MVHIIVPLSEVKINNVDGIDFFNFGIGLSLRDVFNNHFGGSEKHALEVVGLPGILDFNDYQVPVLVFNQDIYPVELVVSGFLIAFTFKDLLNFDVLVQQFGEESFQDIKIGFVSKQPLHCPVEPN